jgi:hypothetical protein
MGIAVVAVDNNLDSAVLPEFSSAFKIAGVVRGLVLHLEHIVDTYILCISARWPGKLDLRPRGYLEKLIPRIARLSLPRDFDGGSAGAVNKKRRGHQEHAPRSHLPRTVRSTRSSNNENKDSCFDTAAAAA